MARNKSINFPNTETELSALFDKLQRAVTNRLISTGTLAIHGASSALAKTTTVAYLLVDGQLVKVAAADMPALSGSVTNAKFNVFVFSVTAAGVVSTLMGTEASTLAGVVFPTIPDGSTSLGFVIVNPTGTGPFVGGTTALDDGTVVPNAVYVNSGDAYNASLSTL